MRNELGLFGSEKKTLRELERESEGAMKRKLGPTEGSKVQSCVSNNSCVPGASFLLSLSRASHRFWQDQHKHSLVCILAFARSV